MSDLREALQETHDTLVAMNREKSINHYCCCEVANDNPNYKGKHTEDCKRAWRAIVKARLAI